MKIQISQPKISNLYSFISQLSQWNGLVCIPKRKAMWLKQTGILTNKDKLALKKFTKIFRQAHINLEPIFLFEDQKMIWANVRKIIGKVKTKEIKLIFNEFEDRFDIIWPEENKKLKIIAKVYQSQKHTINKNLKVIASLCGLTQNEWPKVIKLRLILSDQGINDCQGWTHQNAIALECSSWSIKKIKYLIHAIFLHECFHVLFSNNKKLFLTTQKIIRKNRTLINKVGLKPWPAEIVFIEALISCFLPEGYLSNKFLNINALNIARKAISKAHLDNFNHFRYFCALNLYPLAKEYITHNKPIDAFYLEQILTCIQKF